MSSHLMHIQRILSCMATVWRLVMEAVLNIHEVLNNGLGHG